MKVVINDESKKNFVVFLKYMEVGGSSILLTLVGPKLTLIPTASKP
jgi:hypothetical protein